MGFLIKDFLVLLPISRHVCAGAPTCFSFDFCFYIIEKILVWIDFYMDLVNENGAWLKLEGTIHIVRLMSYMYFGDLIRGGCFL